MCREQHGLALILELDESPLQQHSVHRIETAERLVHDDQPGIVQNRADELNLLLHSFEELSKGMQQKIQFIGAILHDPGLIIMDEPFSGLDPVNAVLLERTLVELKDQGKAVLFSTHRMDQVEKLCDSICLINKGEAVLSGRVRDIKSRYERN